jgi:hypothetical protein
VPHGVVPAPPAHAPIAQVRIVPGQVLPAATQTSRMQHPPSPQPVPSQQGPPGMPHAIDAPSLHTEVAPSGVPEATQLPALQQPPPWQVSPAQQGVPGRPQTSQVPAAPQVPMPAQVAPTVTQRSEDASQHPLSHASPAQQGSPGPPHEAHTPPAHARSAEQTSPLQQG